MAVYVLLESFFYFQLINSFSGINDLFGDDADDEVEEDRISPLAVTGFYLEKELHFFVSPWSSEKSK